MSFTYPQYIGGFTISGIDDIWGAYHQGETDAEEAGISGVAVHETFGHIMGAMLPGGDSDEEIAYEKGYHGDELEICDDCEHVIENCECEEHKEGSGESSSESSSSSSSSDSDSDNDGDDGDDGGSYTTYESEYDSGEYSGGSGGGSSYTGGGGYSGRTGSSESAGSGYYSGGSSSHGLGSTLGALSVLACVGLVLYVGISSVVSRIGSSGTSPSGTSTFPSQSSKTNNKSQLTGKTPKPPNCALVIKRIRAGKQAEIPTECDSQYQDYLENERLAQETRAQQDSDKRQESERLAYEKQEQDRQKAEQQADLERRRQDDERIRNDNARNEKIRTDAEAARREEEAENRRRQARDEAQQREQERQRQAQQSRENLIRLGEQIHDKIFRKRP